MHNKLLFILAAVLCARVLAAEPPHSALKDQEDRIAYSLGNQLGNDMRRLHVEIQADAFRRGIEDAMAGKSPLIDPPRMNALLADIKRRLQRQRLLQRQAGGAKVRELGERFRATNAKRPGVHTTTSGLQYQILTAGNGRRPSSRDQVVIDYLARRADGAEFSSTFRRGQPETHRLDHLIRGLQEAVSMMKEGATWRIVLPPELAFARNTPMEGWTVVYELTLRKVIPEKNKQ